MIHESFQKDGPSAAFIDMTGASPQIAFDESSGPAPAPRSGSARPHASARQLLPIHRLTVIAKTPFLVALGLYVSGGHFAWPTVGVTLVLASLIWGVLYAVNEAFDLTLEEGWVVPRAAISALVAAVLIICAIAYSVSPALALLFGIMTAGQLAYCMPPIRLKRWWWPVLVLSGIVNPVLRAYCGAIWGPQPIPFLVLAAIVLVHVGATVRTRALQRERDRNLRYRVSPERLDRLGVFFTGLGLIDSAWLCALNVFPRIFLLTSPVVVGFVMYAWSERAKSMKKVRRGWILFVVGAAFGLVILLRGQ
jgi:hypothetical protein